MQIHQLKPIHKNKKKKRIGRGGKRGTYSGRGQKGQKSRAGSKMAPAIRELIKRYPKLKGYKSKRIEKNIAIVNIDVLNENFKDLEIVNPKSLLEKKLISKIKGNTPKVKILSKGKLTKKLIIENCDTSKAVKEIVEKIGGKVKISKIKKAEQVKNSNSVDKKPVKNFPGENIKTGEEKPKK
ncbi:MAG: 50S ribosomal protein L15 [Candidatus Nealsonbacteria bacterium]